MMNGLTLIVRDTESSSNGKEDSRSNFTRDLTLKIQLANGSRHTLSISIKISSKYITKDGLPSSTNIFPFLLNNLTLNMLKSASIHQHSATLNLISLLTRLKEIML